MANVFEGDARRLDARTARYVAGDATTGPAYVAGADIWTPFQVFKLADGQAVELPSSAWDTIQFLYGTSAVPSVRDQRLADAIADGLYQIRFDIQVRNIANAVGPVVVTATAYSDTGGDAATATQTETLTLSASSASEDATVTLDIGTAMQSFSITADASGVAPHANGTLQIQAVNVRYIPLIKEVAKNAIDRDELAAPVRGALVESVATLPDVAGYSLGEKVYLEGTDGDNPAGFYILVAAGARRVWQQAVAAGGGGGTGGGAIALATRVAAFQIPVIATQNLDTTAADTPVAYTIPAFSGDSVAGVAQQSVVNGQGRITMLAAGVAEMIVEDELEIVSSNAGGAGADGFVEWGIAQFSADGTPLRQWIQNFAIQDQITRPISIAITVSTGIVPVANGDYFQFIIGFASASASARRLRFAFPTDEPLLQERVEIVLLRGATEGDTGAGVTEAQVNQLITASLANYLTATQVQNALTTALTPYSTTSEIATSIATALTPYRTATQITALINAIRQVSTGGTTGQILTRQSGGGYGWADAPSGGGGQTASQVSAAITAALAQYRTITQITALINAVRQVSSGGTTGQVLTKTATGYDWMNAPATGRTEAQVNTAIATALGPYSTTAQVTALINAVRQVSTGGTQGQILTRLTGNAYGWADAPSGGGGGLTQTQVLALIRANEDNQSYAIREALLNVLLQPVAGQASVTFTSVTAGTPENFDNRLQAAADDFIRLDFVQVNNNGDVTKTYDPIIAVREDILALTNSATVDTALTNAANYQSFPLKVNGVTQTENTIRIGRSGNSLLIAFGTTQAQAYRATIAGLDQRISGDEVLRVINKFADGAIEGRLISNPEIPYGTTLPAITGRRPGSVFVLEGDDSNVLQWLRPAESAAATNRNRVQIVVGQTDDAFVEWVDPIIGSAPDNFQDFVGGLRRIQERTTGGPNQYRYYLYLREGALSALGINTDTDGGTKFWATIRGSVRPFIREANDTTVPINGANYVEFKTAAGPGTTISPFTVGATENLLFWSNSGGSATINIKPATERNSEAWEALGGAAATDGGGGTGGPGITWTEILDYNPATAQQITANNNLLMAAFSRALTDADNDSVLQVIVTPANAADSQTFPRSVARYIKVSDYRDLSVSATNINYRVIGNRAATEALYLGALTVPQADTAINIWMTRTANDRINLYTDRNNAYIRSVKVRLMEFTGGGSGGGTGGGTGTPAAFAQENLVDYTPTRKLAAGSSQIFRFRNAETARVTGLTAADDDNFLLVKILFSASTSASPNRSRRPFAFPRLIKVSDFRALADFGSGSLATRIDQPIINLGRYFYTDNDTGSVQVWIGKRQTDIGVITDNTTAVLQNITIDIVRVTGGGGGGGDAAVPSGATFPAMPALDDEFDLTAQQTVALPAFLTAGRSGLHMTGDIYGWDGTFGNIDRVGTGIDSILWYDNTSTNVLANRQRVTVGRVGTNSRTPESITIGDTTYTLQRVSASSHFWRTTLAIASNPFSMRTQVQITYTDDSKEYPDEIYNPGRYQWNGLEWQKTSPLDGADVRQALQDLPAGERLNIRYIDGVQRSRYETIIYDQAAPTGINVTQTNRAVEGALQLLTPAFEMDVQNNGEIHVAAQIGVSTRGNNTLGFTADALQQVRITDILFLTELLNSAPYVVGGTVEGIRVGNPIDVYADSALQGQIEIRLARDALYQLGFVFRYTPGAGTANTNFAAGVHMSMSFSPTDDGNNGWRTLLDWTTNGASPPRIMNAYEVPAAQAFPVPDIIRSGFMQMYISYGAASSHVLVDRIPAAVTTPLDWSAYRDLPNHTYVNRAQLQGYQIGRLLASSGVGGTQAWWVSKGPNGRLQLVTGNTTLYLYRLVVNSFTIA